jgi:hypothetical protein
MIGNTKSALAVLLLALLAIGGAHGELEGSCARSRARSPPPLSSLLSTQQQLILQALTPTA